MIKIIQGDITTPAIDAIVNAIPSGAANSAATVAAVSICLDPVDEK